MAAIFTFLFIIGYVYIERMCYPKPPEDMARPLTDAERTELTMKLAAKGYTVVDKSLDALILKKGKKVVNLKTVEDGYKATFPSFFWWRVGAFILLAYLFGIFNPPTLPDTKKPTTPVAAASKPAPKAAPLAPITADDFVFDEKALPVKYKDLVVKAVNKIRQEDARCQKHIEPATTSLSGSRSTPKSPTFYVMCGEGLESANVFFTPADISNGKVFKAPKHFPDLQGTGTAICQRFAKLRANNPATVDFDWGTDAVELADGRSVLTLKFTAKNSFGVPGRLAAECTFNEQGMVDGRVFEIVE